MKKILFLLILLSVLSGCKNEDLVTIRGKLGGTEATGQYIKVNRADINSIKFLDSTKIKRNGDFSLRLKSSVPDFYQLALSNDNFITLLAEPGEKIKLHFESERLYENYRVEGSEGSVLVKTLDDRLMTTKRKLDSLNAVYQKASKEPGFEAVQPQLEQQMSDLVRAQRKFNIEFVINNINSLASVKALFQKLHEEAYVLYDPRDLQYMKIVSDSLRKNYPDSRHTKALLTTFEKEMAQFNARKYIAMIDTLPEVKLDAVLKDINGRQVALSSLRGKYVLLTFWSADSRECVADNMQLKEFYRLYNRKGFEIYQINLDKDEETWKAAVKFDELPWISVREEDPSYQKSAVIFNVRSLPANYLFDPAGNIIGSNLHGRALQLKLAQLFKN
ncbi:MAG: AhpC/TSA family protein [Bacteroidales bacterium]|nr:AhpC/TSA family protein [Bacteroidales bacterium]MBN2632012.1 AhpC/TSA family protein [Bacteroidales bacterium]